MKIFLNLIFLVLPINWFISICWTSSALAVFSCAGILTSLETSNF